jgi:glycosyltransferase involved in cell wall biosynthesis
MSRPIRVLELRSVAGTGGGPDKTLVASADIRDPDVDLTLCYLCNEGDDLFQIGALAKQKGLDYVEVRERGPIDLRAWRAIRQLARERRFDIAHGHDYKTDLLAWMLGRAEGLIPFATAHGWTGHSRMERFVYYPADRRLLKRFPRIAAVSGEIRDVLVRAGTERQRVTVIPNGIDPDAFHRDSSLGARVRNEFGISPDAVVLGAVGRLEPQKRFDLVIDAFAMLLGDFPGLYLLIAGEGSLRRDLQRRIDQSGLAGRARLVGHTDVRLFHHALNVFIQSSDYEGTPNVVLEAMALETPVVATDAGGTSELCTDRVHGLLVPRSRTDLLVEAVRETLNNDTATAARVRAARRRVETELSFQRRLERINAIYRELMNGALQAKPRSAT